MKKSINFIVRLIAFPFWAGIVLVVTIKMFLEHCAYFLMYGGEAITYWQKDQYRTINDVYKSLSNGISKAGEAAKNKEEDPVNDARPPSPRTGQKTGI